MIKVIVQRKAREEQESYNEIFDIEKIEHITVDVLLDNINRENCNRSDWRPIEWECSCMEGMCGACAMVINGVPRLACQTFCDELVKESNQIVIKPLSKFENIVDLVVDRLIMEKQKQMMNVWKKEYGVFQIDQKSNTDLGLCLMCGCCVEVCPAFYKKKEFPGMATLVAIGNLINTDNVNMYEKKIKNNFMDSCYRDMNCEKVCPMKLHISENFASILKMIENKQDG